MTNTKHAGGRPRKGSLYYTKSGWRARLTITIDGENVQKTFDLKTHDKSAAKAKLRRLVKENRPPEELAREAARKDTFEEVARREVAEWKKTGMTTWHDRERRLEMYVFAEIGPKAPEDIKAADVLEILKAVRDQGKSRQMMTHVKTDISAVLNVLWRAEQIPENVCARVVVPDALPKAAERSSKERAVLTDAELVAYLGWQHPVEQFQKGVLQRQVMSVLARVFGGLRTGDEHALVWELFEVENGGFGWGYAPRRKTRKHGGKPQQLEIPSIARPILRDWWERQGRPTTGPVFPVLRGNRAGEHKEGGSHAHAFRTDLRRAFGIDGRKPFEIVRKNKRKLNRDRWEKVRDLTPRELVLLEETDSTLPVDFHSWRRRFNQALADAGVNAQQAQALAGHASLQAHERYLRNTQKMRTMPAAAVPHTLTARIAVSASLMQKPDNQNQESRVGVRGFEPPTAGTQSATNGRNPAQNAATDDTAAVAEEALLASSEVGCKNSMLKPIVSTAAAEMALTAYLRGLADEIVSAFG